MLRGPVRSRRRSTIAASITFSFRGSQTLKHHYRAVKPPKRFRMRRSSDPTCAWMRNRARYALTIVLPIAEEPISSILADLSRFQAGLGAFHASFEKIKAGELTDNSGYAATIPSLGHTSFSAQKHEQPRLRVKNVSGFRGLTKAFGPKRLAGVNPRCQTFQKGVGGQRGLAQGIPPIP